MKPGPSHPSWQRGFYINSDGYPRYSALPNRGKYVHRVKADAQLMESYGRHLRPDEEVHHQNFIRTCVCDFNLIIMDAPLHHAISGWLKNKRPKQKRRKKCKPTSRSKSG